MFDFALTHAYLIPLFPALAFLIIGPFTRNKKDLSATIAIFMMALSLIFSILVALATQVYGITMNDPFVMQITWARIADLPLTMGIFIDPLTAMMLLVVTLVSLLVYIYSASYMANDPGMGRFFAFICDDARARRRRELPAALRLLGGRRPLLVPPDRLLL